MSDEQDFELDELASAYLDGEAAPGERAVVEADPALVARVDEFRSLRQALRRDLAAVDQRQLESALATALAVFDTEVGAGGERRDGAADVERDPVDLAAVRERRQRRWWKPVAAVAGAAAMAVAVVSGIANLSADGDDEATTAEGSVVDAAAESSSADRAAEDESPGGAEDEAPVTIDAIPEAATAGADTTAGDLAAAVTDVPLTEESSGVALATTEQLVAYATEQVQSALPATDDTTETSPAQTTEPTGCLELGALVAKIVWQGTPAELYLQSAISGERVAIVVTPDCAILVSVTLP